jgi:hypothetical protein
MSEKMLDENEDSPETPAEPVRRLCSEIQLFDLCELEKCSYKSANFCTNEDLLTRFERIADEDTSSRMSLSDEDLDENDEFGGFGFDDDDEHNDFADEDEDL